MACGMRVIEWAFCQKELRRVQINEVDASLFNSGTSYHGNEVTKRHAAKVNQPRTHTSTLSGTLWDALELSGNFRGCGWNWAQTVPPDVRPTSSTSAFLLSTLVSAITHVLLFDLMLSTVRSFSPSTFGSPAGGTIYDPSLPPYHRYARSSFITLAGGITIYAIVQAAYDIMTIICISVLQQRPTQWPPIFDSPWLSTSLTAHWGRRWHQLLRGIFINIGTRPLSSLTGRVGGVMGAFFWSAVLHDFGMWGVGRGTEFWSIGGFFLMHGVGCILEALFKKATGMKVVGWVGWVWTMSWLVGWGHLLVDAYARRGLVGCKFVPEGYMPSQIIASYINGHST